MDPKRFRDAAAGAADGLRRVIDIASRIIAVACLAATFLALLVNVVLRYFFGPGIAWAFGIHAVLLGSWSLAS